MGLVPMPHPMPANNEREVHLRVLADKLLFKVERSGECFTLTRTADVSKPVRHERLTIEQAEELLGARPRRRLSGQAPGVMLLPQLRPIAGCHAIALQMPRSLATWPLPKHQ